MNFQKRVIENIERYGDRPLITIINNSGSEISLNYREFCQFAIQYGAGLRREGVRTGSKVLFCTAHGLPLFIGIAGCLLQGVVPVVFAHPSTKLPLDDYALMITALAEQLMPDLVIAEAAALPAMAELPFRVCFTSRFSTRELQNLPKLLPRLVDPERIALIQYSSGTTGLKKGVRISERALLDQVDRYGAAIGLRPDDVVASWLPLYHDMGLIACFLLPWLCAVPIVSMSPFDWLVRPDIFLAATSRHGATLMWQPNFAFAHLARWFADKGTSDFDLTRLRMIVNCSEPITRASQDAFLSAFAQAGISANRIASCYAMAETTFAVTTTRPGQAQATVSFDTIVRPISDQIAPASGVLVSSGRVVDGASVCIVADDGAILGPDQVGEIVVRSSSMMTGYLGVDPSQTFLADGSHCTGDLGFLHDGELYVLGRKDDVIVVRGQNLFPERIEEIVSQAPGVVPGRCVAFGIEVEDMGSAELVVLAETRETDERCQADIVAEIRRRLAGRIDILPHVVELRPHMSLDKSTSGKIARKANRTAFQAGRITRQRGTGADTAADFPTKLRAFVYETFGAGAAVIDTAPLISGGLVDSLGLVNLLLFLDQTSGFQIPSPIDVGFDRFDSIERIERLVEDVKLGKFEMARSETILVFAKLALYRASSRDFDLFMLSSSTLALAPTAALLSLGHKGFNFAISGANPLDYYALLREIERVSRKMPRRLIMGIDPERLFQRFLSPTFSKSDELSHYLRDVGVIAPKVAGPEDARERALRQLRDAEWRPLRYFPTLLENGDTVNETGAGPVEFFRISEAEAQSALTAMRLRLYRQGDEVFRPIGRALLAIAKICRKHEIRIDLVFPPLHPSLLNYFADEPRYDRYLRLARETLMATGFDDAVLHDFRDIRSFGGDPNDFDDPYHSGPRNCRLLLERIASDQPGSQSTRLVNGNASRLR